MAAALSMKNRLLPFIGKSIGATINETDDTHLMAAVNAALMDLLADRLAENRSELVRAPTSVTLDNVTANSKALTFAGYETWMLGCTIQIGSTWNRLVKPGASVSLESHYSGDTAASVAATVYQDVVNLDYAIDAPMHPVLLDGRYPLTLVSHAAQLEALRQCIDGNPPRGLPRFALMNDNLSLNATPQTRFVFESLPGQRYTLSFEAALRPTQIAAWDDATPFLLPGGRDVEILAPVARFYLSSYPVFIGDRGEAQQDYGLAKQKWAAYSNKGSQPGELDIHGC